MNPQSLLNTIVLSTLLTSASAFAQSPVKSLPLLRAGQISTGPSMTDLKNTNLSALKTDLSGLPQSSMNGKITTVAPEQKVKGPIATGGGNLGSKQAATIFQFLGVQPSGDADIKKNLIKVLQTFAVNPPKSEVSYQIVFLIENGVIQDIMNSKYVIKDICKDETGVEKAASTKKINLIQNPHQPSPEVCLNLTKMIADKPTYMAIMGLLLHEHSRHYGFEDTDATGTIHPMALVLETAYLQLYAYQKFDVATPGLIVKTTDLKTPESVQDPVKRNINRLTVASDAEQVDVLTPGNFIASFIDVEVEVKDFDENCNDGYVAHWPLNANYGYRTQLKFDPTQKNRFKLPLGESEIIAKKYSKRSGYSNNVSCTALVSVFYKNELRFEKRVEVSSLKISNTRLEYDSSGF